MHWKRRWQTTMLFLTILQKSCINKTTILHRWKPLPVKRSSLRTPLHVHQQWNADQVVSRLHTTVTWTQWSWCGARQRVTLRDTTKHWNFVSPGQVTSALIQIRPQRWQAAQHRRRRNKQRRTASALRHEFGYGRHPTVTKLLLTEVNDCMNGYIVFILWFLLLKIARKYIFFSDRLFDWTECPILGGNERSASRSSNHSNVMRKDTNVFMLGLK
jgi:hypothetical protein